MTDVNTRLNIPHSPSTVPPAEPVVEPGRFEKYLPAIPEHFPGATRLIADLIDLASQLVPGENRERARDIMRARLVRIPNTRSVVYAAIEFEPEIDHRGTIRAVAWYHQLPGSTQERVKIVPLITMGPEYLKPSSDGTLFISGGTFQCILFSPHNGKGPYKALPLGLADKKTLNSWREIVQRRNAAFTDAAPLPEITPIPHDLRKPGVRRIAFVPHFLHETPNGPGRKRLRVGTHYGLPVYLSAKSTPPVVDNPISKSFTRPHLFRVHRLRETELELVWLGPQDDVCLEERLDLGDVKHEINPFDVLNVDPKFVRWEAIELTTRKWVNGARPYDEHNPLFVAAMELGLVRKDDEPNLVRAHLEQLWKESTQRLQAEMERAKQTAVEHMSRALRSPSYQELAGNTAYASLLFTLNTPTDRAAEWVMKTLAWKTFDPKSPFAMALRAWLIERTYNKKMGNSGAQTATSTAPEPASVPPKREASGVFAGISLPPKPDVNPSSILLPSPNREGSRPRISVPSGVLSLENPPMDELDHTSLTNEPTIAMSEPDELPFVSS